jgi:hypothetical protein
MAAALALLSASRLAAQPAAEPPSAIAYQPIRPGGRVEWIVDGTFGAQSLATGVAAATLGTGLDVPPEWRRSWDGFGRRYLQREADVAISGSIEAGLGALWSEEPRYIRSARKGIWPRARYALKTVLLSQRRDGHLAPAWGRYASNVVNNVVENAWLPPTATTWQATTLRSVSGFLGRAGGNLWNEFWPDVHRRVFQQ